jgi:hypothetical protein
MLITLLVAPPAEPTAWNITLNVSDLIGLLGIVATILGVGFGFYQMSQAQDAKEETRAARALLLRQQAAQHFSDVAGDSLNLYRTVRTGKWRESAEIASLLIANLANARGFPDQVLSSEHKETVEGSLRVLISLAPHIPLGDSEDVTGDRRHEMSQYCQEVLVAVNRVAGSLKIETALGGETDEHQTQQPAHRLSIG